VLHPENQVDVLAVICENIPEILMKLGRKYPSFEEEKTVLALPDILAQGVPGYRFAQVIDVGR